MEDIVVESNVKFKDNDHETRSNGYLQFSCLFDILKVKINHATSETHLIRFPGEELENDCTNSFLYQVCRLDHLFEKT